MSDKSYKQGDNPSPETPPRPPMESGNNLINTQSHTGGEIKRRGRPKGSVANKQTREAMKRQFSRVITPKKFASMVELVYNQAMDGDKKSQGLIFEYGMIKPGMEVDQPRGGIGIQIVINDMKDENVIEDGVWQEEAEAQG